MFTNHQGKQLQLQLPEIQASLDNLSLQLLRNTFLDEEVENYYKLAERFIDELLKTDKNYGLEALGSKPLEALIRLSIDKIASAYVLISGKAEKEKVNALINKYSIIVENYLEEMGILS